jgi:hypothetical protein
VTALMEPKTAALPEYIDIPRHVWDAVNNAIHTSSVNGNEMPISLCYVAVRAAMKAMKEAA